MESFEEVKEMVYKVMCDSQNLPSEALASAFIAIKEHPDFSIEKALLIGVEDDVFFEHDGFFNNKVNKVKLQKGLKHFFENLQKEILKEYHKKS